MKTPSLPPSGLLATTLAALLAGLLAGPASAAVPPRTHAGQTLEVPEAELDRGQIFYLLPGEETQVAVTSRAPLKRSVLTSSRAVGFLVGTFDPEDSERPLLGAALRVPAVSLESGSAATDGTFHGEGYLNAASHPEITFELTGTDAVSRVAVDEKDVFAFRMKLRGRLTVRGVAREIEAPADVRFWITNFETFNRAVGDLVTLSTSFELAPGEFGWEMPPSDRLLVAERLQVEVFLTGSTRTPDSTWDPEADLQRVLSRQRYLTLARDLEDAEAATEHGKAYLEEYRDDAGALNDLARSILQTPGLAPRDLGLARRLVERANKAGAEGVDLADTESQLAELRGD